VQTKSKNGNLNTVNISEKKTNLLDYLCAVFYNFIGKSFNSSTAKGAILEEYRKKIRVAEKVREFDHILKSINELDVIKTILFNDQQKASLAFLQKPKFTNIETLKKFSTHKEALVNNLQVVENYFSNLICEQGNLNEKDEFLFNQLDQKIQQKILKNSLRINVK
jgi:hypothetical protein